MVTVHGWFIDQRDYFLISFFLFQVQPFKTFELVSSLNQLFLELGKLLFLFSKYVLFLVNLSLKLLICTFQLSALFEDFFNASFDLYHSIIDYTHISPIVLSILDLLFELYYFGLMILLHLFNDTQKYIVSLNCLSFLLFNFVLIKDVQIF